MDKRSFKFSAKWQLRLFLLFAPGILAEILSGNTPVFKLFHPSDLFFLILAYGVPVTLIWEYKVRNSLSVLSIFLLWLAYWLINEWLLAKTILDTSMVPLWWFQDTSDHLGINWSWFFMIIPWHAFFSVLFPLSLAHALFPELENTSLYGKKMNFTFGLLTFIFLPLMASSWQGKISVGIYLFLYSSIIFLVLLVRSALCQKKFQSKNLHGLRWGLAILLFYLFQFTSAGKLPLSIYIPTSIIIISLFLGRFLYMDRENQSKFALGGYLSFWFFALIVTLFAGRYDLIIMYLLLNGGIYLLLKKRGVY